MTEFEKRLKEHEERMRGMQENNEFNNDAAMIRLYTRHRESGGTLSPAEFRRMMVSQSRDLKKAAVERELNGQPWDPEKLKNFKLKPIRDADNFFQRDIERYRKIWEREIMGKPSDEFEEISGWKFKIPEPRKITVQMQIEPIYGKLGDEAPACLMIGGPSHGERQIVGASSPSFWVPTKIANYESISHPDYNPCHGDPTFYKAQYFRCVFQASEEGEEELVYVYEDLDLEEALGLYAALVDTTEEVVCLNAREE